MGDFPFSESPQAWLDCAVFLKTVMSDPNVPFDKMQLSNISQIMLS
jgi:hypothetical protein